MREVALITGGTRGIGLGIAQALATAGFDLAINGVRPEADAASALESLRKLGAQVVYCQGNIGAADDRTRILKTALDRFNNIDVLVNNAGVAPFVRKDLLELDEDNFDRLLDINLKGTFFLTQAAARHMKDSNAARQKPGRIITITSVSATHASINRGEYCISKAGLAMMTKLFAARLASDGISVFEVRPGIIHTDMTSGVQQKYDQLISNGLTLEPRWGEASDVGNAVAVLATGRLSYATGQVLDIGGGMTVERL
ncbi:3-ketoacyl-ACP reductase [Chryseolinea sp. T2]|uniref:3-ketoacyl-ACP reductase n=1 Tax=Chryseolinea sp. T2 TaxID=3129255 RepID=UPI003077E781